MPPAPQSHSSPGSMTPLPQTSGVTHIARSLPSCLTCTQLLPSGHHSALHVVPGGGAAIALGLGLGWLNQPRAHRTEARAPSRFELVPLLSPHRAELSAVTRF